MAVRNKRRDPSEAVVRELRRIIEALPEQDMERLERIRVRRRLGAAEKLKLIMRQLVPSAWWLLEAERAGMFPVPGMRISRGRTSYPDYNAPPADDPSWSPGAACHRYFPAPEGHISIEARLDRISIERARRYSHPQSITAIQLQRIRLMKGREEKDKLSTERTCKKKRLRNKKRLFASSVVEEVCVGKSVEFVAPGRVVSVRE